jgi:hypothetical protein
MLVASVSVIVDIDAYYTSRGIHHVAIESPVEVCVFPDILRRAVVESEVRRAYLNFMSTRPSRPVEVNGIDAAPSPLSPHDAADRVVASHLTKTVEE